MDKTTKTVIEAYNQSIKEYYKNTRNLEPPEIEFRKEFIALLKNKGKILDVACAFGRDSKIFSDAGLKVVGVDLADKAIEKARIMVPKAKFFVKDIRYLDFKPESFDGVWFNAGLISIEKKFALKVLKDLCRILKPEGILFVGVKQGSGEGLELDKRYGVEKYYAYYSEEELKGLLNQAGFEHIKTIIPDLKSSYHTHKWIDVFCRKPAEGI